MDASNNDSLGKLPDELLDSIAGGVLSDDDWASLRELVQNFKDSGAQYEFARPYIIGNARDYLDPSDIPQLEEIIESVYNA